MRVLHLTTYPVRIPRHGGQARVANLMQIYAAAGIEARAVTVYQTELYGGEAVSKHDYPFPERSRFRTSELPLCTDIASGTFAAEDPGAWAHMRAEVQRFRPDVIQLEQPWLWPVVERLRASHPGLRFRVVYSSQNVEAPLKRHMVEGAKDALADEVIGRIDELERRVARESDLSIAVTESDAATLRAFGARRVVVAPNGIVHRTVDPKVLRDWSWSRRDKRFALFVGSAYPPNVKGFWDMLAPSLAFLAPDEYILVVGGIGAILGESPIYREWPGINASRLDLAGIQTETALAALLALASCVILPITVGGGSNIKTAEAIYSGKPVIGTTTSFRGYEFALDLPHVYRTDDPLEFRSRVKQAIEGTLPPTRSDAPELRRRVLWTETLKDVPDEVRALGS